MKRLRTYDSPFPTRVRLLLYAKGIEAEYLEDAAKGRANAGHLAT